MIGLPRPHRSSRLLAGSAAVIALMSGCSSVTPSALSVEDTRVSKDEFEKELKAFETAFLNAKNNQGKTATEAEKKDLLAKIHTQANGGKAWQPAYTAFVLGSHMQDLAVQELFAKSGLETPKISAQVREGVEGNMGGKEAFAKLPKAIQERMLATPAKFDALLKKGSEKLGTPDKFYEAHPDLFVSEACSKHILVKTKSEADAIVKDLQNGGDFAKIAKAKSQDPGSGAQGGDLGCGDPANFVPEFADMVRKVKLDTLSEPVKTQFGYHLIMVKSRKKATLAEAKATLDQSMKQFASKAIQLDFEKLSIAVDPSLGALKRNPGSLPTVQPVGTADAPAVQ